MGSYGGSRKDGRARGCSVGGTGGGSPSASTPFTPWQSRSSSALPPFVADVYGYVLCAKNWQLRPTALATPAGIPSIAAPALGDQPSPKALPQERLGHLTPAGPPPRALAAPHAPRFRPGT